MIMTEETKERVSITFMSGPYDGEERFLDQMPVTLGREPHHLVGLFYDLLVSRNHAKIDLDEMGYCLEDTQSTNGTLLNEEKIKGKTRLASGDVLQLGNTCLKFVIHPGGPEEKPAE
jgi:pSer/pThr/pTyr-binding forkhead associated (FHA) protein